MIYDDDFIYGDNFPADGDWPGARNSVSLAELAGLTSARAGA